MGFPYCMFLFTNKSNEETAATDGVIERLRSEISSTEQQHNKQKEEFIKLKQQNVELKEKLKRQHQFQSQMIKNFLQQLTMLSL